MLFLRLLQHLNLDIIAGAVLSLLMVQKLSGVPSDLGMSVALALAVFSVYGIDRLLDVFGKTESSILTARHRFYFRYFGGLALLNAQAVWVGGVVAWQAVPSPVLNFGLVLALFTILYLILVQILTKNILRFFPKKMIVVVIYTVGIWGAVKAQGGTTSLEWYVCAVNFGLVALLNLLLFAHYEYEKDIRQNQVTALISIGKQGIVRAFYTVFLLIIALTASFIFLQPSYMFWCVIATELAMACWLVFVWQRKSWFGRFSRYRFGADLVFWFPAWLL